MSFQYILEMAFVLAGIYLVIISLWELKKGTDKKKFVLGMFFGLVLIIVTPNIFV